MLPTFVVTLREGVEAALIVGIVAAFLVKEGRRDAMSRMWIGVGAAVALCVAIAVALRLLGERLPERGQEGLETVLTLVAVAMVTYMIVWMRRHARGLKAALQSSASSALLAGSGVALAAMAFVAVLREGLETTVFLLAVFADRPDPETAGAGGILGLAAAVAIGLALYRGGTRIDLARFFRLTALVLVVVAGGLVATAVHAAHEAGWSTPSRVRPSTRPGWWPPGASEARSSRACSGCTSTRPWARPPGGSSTRSPSPRTSSGRIGGARPSSPSDGRGRLAAKSSPSWARPATQWRPQQRAVSMAACEPLWPERRDRRAPPSPSRRSSACRPPPAPRAARPRAPGRPPPEVTRSCARPSPAAR